MRMTADMASYPPAVLVLSAVARLLTASHPGVARGVAGVAGGLGGDDVRRGAAAAAVAAGPVTVRAPGLVPAESFDWMPFVALSLLALALSVAGQLAFRRRDIHQRACHVAAPARLAPAPERVRRVHGRRVAHRAGRPGGGRQAGRRARRRRPPELSGAAALRPLAARRRRRHDRRRRGHPACAGRAWVRSRRTTRASPSPRRGRGRRDQRPVRRPRAGTLRRGHLEAGALAGPQPPARPDGPGGAARRWRTLARTTVADVADVLWNRRGELLAARTPVQVPVHGDAVPATCPGRDGDDVLAVDWAMVGTGPVGSDLGFYALAAREELDPLIDAYRWACPTGWPPATEVTLGARVTAVYRAQPGRVGPGLGRRRRGRPRRQVPPPPSLRTCVPSSASSPTSRRWSRAERGRWGRPPSSTGWIGRQPQVFWPNPAVGESACSREPAVGRSPAVDSKRADPGTSSGMYADWSPTARFRGQNPAVGDNPHGFWRQSDPAASRATFRPRRRRRCRGLQGA